MAKLFIIRTAIGREEQVLDFLASNAKKASNSIFSLLHPQGMTGYIIVEAEELPAIKQVAFGVPYVRGILSKPVSMSEIEGMIEFKPEEIDLNKGDIVSITAGPFKGEKAKVSRVDKTKAQVVLELLEAAVPIPITLGMDSVKVIGKKEGEEAKAE